MTELLSIIMKPLRFYSKLDEDSLIRNLENIEFVDSIDFIDSGLNIFVDKCKCDWEGFKDILSLFLRYNLDINLLSELVPDGEVKAWFFAPERDWHNRIVRNNTA